MSPAWGAEGRDWPGWGWGREVGRERMKQECCGVGGLERLCELGDAEMCSPNSEAAGEGRSEKERGAGGASLRLND